MGSGFSRPRNRFKCERVTEMIIKCESPNSQINTIRQVMKESLQFITIELLNSRFSESSGNIIQS